MIKFFRRIRFDLMEKNKTGLPEQRVRAGKYLKYAIGEIVLVMIGILLALQVNTWNENRKIDKQELQLIASLQKEFTFNNDEIDRSIKKAQIIQSRCETILKNTGNHDMKLSKNESDSLITSGLLNIITYDPSNGILSDIINSGKIQIIKNEKLKNYLSNWNGILNDVKEDETWAVNERNNIVFPFIYKHSNYINLTQGRVESNSIISGFETDYKDMYKYQEFENLVLSHMIWNGKNELNYKKLKSSIGEILELCEQELSLKK